MKLLDFSVRIVISLLLGTLIGFERQLTGHPAGIRTNMLICLGACMFLLFPMVMGSNDIQRVASYIVSGVGFLCSGVIFKENGTVKGLNTAATLWCTAAIGVLTSSGMYLYSMISTIVLIMANILFRPLAKKISPLDSFNEEENFYRIIIIYYKKFKLNMNTLMPNEIDNIKLPLIDLEIRNIDRQKIQLKITYKIAEKKVDQIIKKITSQIISVDGVKTVEWEIV